MRVETMSSPLLPRALLRNVMWRVSLGGWFELYDLFMTAYIGLGLMRDKLFAATTSAPFDAHGFASFVASGFAGMFVGTLVFAWVSDRFGRRFSFTISLLWYSVATIVMAFSHSDIAINFWRFVAGVGIGVQIITIDTYITEVSPPEDRGRWVAFSQLVGYTAIPVVALLAYLLVPREIAGLSGWRIVALVGALGAVAVWPLRRGLPESPRWLQTRVPRETNERWSDLFAPHLRTRTIAMVIFNVFQTVGFYGFASWVPILLAKEGVETIHSLLYVFVIALANPAGPYLAMQFADRLERKWQIVTLALTIACCGIAFSYARAPLAIMIFGAAVTIANAWFSAVFHAYQAELFPTAIRAQAVGFVYAWSRFSSIFVGFAIAAILLRAGTVGVFIVIGAAMLIVAAVISLFGPITNGRSLELLAARSGPEAD
ncbi:MAG: MFS transporter [Candidatus Eremiobacteraeota bacterium]|nr:MFS transporter [Candidatus Eremiobacteraeota bacterium]